MDQEQLRNLEAQCIQEHAPPCSAACPLHVDVRGVLAALARDDFDAALQLLVKRLPFPPSSGACANNLAAPSAIAVAWAAR
jgi:NADPH-dependent glutamate synthase beta subunit-like oxidoreductase